MLLYIMTSKHRVFSNNNDTNYIEYIKNKQGIENLKAIKYSSENININRFNNYEQFIIFSKSYYKYKDLNCCQIKPTQNLFNSNISYINNNHLFSKLEHNNNECILLKQVLYPYGHYQSNKVSNMYFPYKINLDNWCLKKKQCELYTFSNNMNNKNDNGHDNNCNNNNCNNCNCNNCNNNNCNNNNCNINNNNNNNDKKCKTGLCGNTKQLFI